MVTDSWLPLPCVVGITFPFHTLLKCRDGCENVTQPGTSITDGSDAPAQQLVGLKRGLSVKLGQTLGDLCTTQLPTDSLP